MKLRTTIESTLKEYGRLRPLKLGPTSEPTEADHGRIVDQLDLAIRRSGTVFWTCIGVVVILTGAGFSVAAASGAPGYIAAVGGVTTLSSIPLGWFLRRLWMDKFMIEALAIIAPGLTTVQLLDALERIWFQDKSGFKSKE